jgi:hypothetical protein
MAASLDRQLPFTIFSVGLIARSIAMSSVSKTAIWLGALACAGAIGVAGVAAAQTVPKNWTYEIKGGKRVPKTDRVTNADGSWREETRQGKCITVKEKSPTGEYKETRRCD